MRMLYNNVDRLTEAQAIQLHALYQREWWTAGRTLEDVRAMLAGSDHLYGICDGETAQLAGFARVLTDGVFKALVFDVIDSALPVGSIAFYSWGNNGARFDNLAVEEIILVPERRSPAGIDSVMNAFPPTTAPRPITVSPPRIVALA